MSVPKAWQQVRDGRKAGWPELRGHLGVRIPPWQLLSHQTSAFDSGGGEVGEAGEGQGSVAAGCVAVLSSGACCASLQVRATEGSHLLRFSHAGSGSWLCF